MSKGAVLAAMKVLPENMGMPFAGLERIYAAGGFGTLLDVDKAIFDGLLPDIPQEPIRFIGISSLACAGQALRSVHAFHKAETIAKQMICFELPVYPEFMSEFTASLFCLMFKWSFSLP
jgi:uncharacterized 2Fe-2S/4Fe-4S cluster protein (DUF4445 family)